MKNQFEQQVKENKPIEFNKDRSFDEMCEILRATPLTSEMSYKERLAMQKLRYGL
jgi:hypothetical protein